MKKFRLLLDSEKEIAWLNQLSDQGWKLVSFFLGFYTFESCEKGKYRYQEDTATSFGKVSEDYRTFMEDAGIEIVQVWGPWVILCKEASVGPFELFTDYESRLKHQKKQLVLFKFFTIIEMICFFMEILSIVKGGSKIAILFAIIIGFILVVFCRMVLRVKSRINRLKAENCEGPSNTRMPVVMSIGYLLFLVFLLIKDSQMQMLATVIRIVACVFMFISLVKILVDTRDK